MAELEGFRTIYKLDISDIHKPHLLNFYLETPISLDHIKNAV